MWMYFYPTASAANVPAPSSLQRDLKYFSCYLSGCSQTGVFFLTPAAKTFSGHWSFPGSLPFILASTILGWDAGFCWPQRWREIYFFPSPPWFRDSSRYTKASWPEQFSELQTGDGLQRTCNIPHDYAEMRQSALTIICLRILFFWNMLTFYHCVDFSGTTTQMQGLCLCS